MIFHAAGAHYFCETLDITRPFPSEQPVFQPSWPFVWNKALTLPFRAAGLDGVHSCCPPLLQVRGACSRWSSGLRGRCSAAWHGLVLATFTVQFL